MYYVSIQKESARFEHQGRGERGREYTFTNLFTVSMATDDTLTSRKLLTKNCLQKTAYKLQHITYLQKSGT